MYNGQKWNACWIRLLGRYPTGILVLLVDDKFLLGIFYR